MTGRIVVGRSRPVRTSSAPAKALISELLPVPVPPKVATTRGDSSRMRRVPRRRVSRSIIARQVSAGRHAGAERGPAFQPPPQGINFGQKFEMI